MATSERNNLAARRGQDKDDDDDPVTKIDLAAAHEAFKRFDKDHSGSIDTKVVQSRGRSRRGILHLKGQSCQTNLGEPRFPQTQARPKVKAH